MKYILSLCICLVIVNCAFLRTEQRQYTISTLQAGNYRLVNAHYYKRTSLNRALNDIVHRRNISPYYNRYTLYKRSLWGWYKKATYTDYNLKDSSCLVEFYRQHGKTHLPEITYTFNLCDTTIRLHIKP